MEISNHSLRVVNSLTGLGKEGNVKSVVLVEVGISQTQMRIKTNKFKGLLFINSHYDISLFSIMCIDEVTHESMIKDVNTNKLIDFINSLETKVVGQRAPQCTMIPSSGNNKPICA